MYNWFILYGSMKKSKGMSFFMLRKQFVAGTLLCAAILGLSVLFSGCSGTDAQQDSLFTDTDAASDGVSLQTAQTGQEAVWIYYSTPMLSRPEEWSETLAKTDRLVMTLSQLKSLTRSERDTLIELQSGGLRLAVELQGIIPTFCADGFHDAEDSLGVHSVVHSEKGELTLLRSTLDAGVRIDTLIFCDSMKNAMYPRKTAGMYVNAAEAAFECAAAMACWKNALPDVEFYYSYDFIHYGWGSQAAYKGSDNGAYGWGDAQYQTGLLADAVQQKGLTLSGVILREPYDYVRGHGARTDYTIDSPADVDWMQLLTQAEQFCENAGLSFLLNISPGGSEGTNLRYLKSMVRYIDAYESAGGTPGGYLLTSLKGYPNRIIGEKDPLTYTNTALLIAGQLKDGKPVDLSAYGNDSTVQVPDNLSLVHAWTFDDGLEGWAVQNGISVFEAENGYLDIVSNSGDPYCGVGFTGERCEDCTYLYLRYVNLSSESAEMQLFFTTTDAGGMNEAMSIIFPMEMISDDPEIWNEIYVRMDACAFWTGDLTAIRLDPGNMPGEILIDEIAFYKQG